MSQYWDLKNQAGDALLLFRMGDFYELFGDDATLASKILEITLTTRDRNKLNPIPMAGVPHHSAATYIQRLLRAGKKVAIAEQLEEAPSNGTKKGIKIVRREIVRTFTPGIQFDYEGSEANYLAALVRGPDSLSALACLDISTGETITSGLMDEETLESELSKLPIRHILTITSEDESNRIKSQLKTEVLVESLPVNYISQTDAFNLLNLQYDISNILEFVATGAAAHALGIAVKYSLKTQKRETLQHLRLPISLHRSTSMVLGPKTAQHLDIIGEPMDGAPSLFKMINDSRSAMGSRKIKKWLLAPLKNPREILIRQNAVKELCSSRFRALPEKLGHVYDLERIIARITAGLANPRDTLALGTSLGLLGNFAIKLESCESSHLTGLRQAMAEKNAALEELSRRITKSQTENPPLTSKDGDIFRVGTSTELDRLILINQDGERWLLDLENRERAQTGITSLKVRYNRVFGYYIEVTQSYLKNVPSHYHRRQTTAGGERFVTEELKKFEDEILNASTRRKLLEHDLFIELLGDIKKHTNHIMDAAELIAELDALCSLSRYGNEPGWCFPVIDDSMDLAIEQGRHPLVDTVNRGSFVPNDIELSNSTRLGMIITGPNMGGKSTVMRQTAIIVILGQMGAPVPAKNARWGSVSSLYTRIGAHDAIAMGQSTFMVEMSELAHILHKADNRSLIILDEIGRGTSTYDGISVAWATLEWLSTKIEPRLMFATHYHELTRLTSTLPKLANMHMAVEGAKNPGNAKLRFLYKLNEGPANESFGIHVARLAGLPKPLIERAWKILDDLEQASPKADASNSCDQLPLFIEKVQEKEPHEVIRELENTDVNEMTPLQALNFVAKLRGLCKPLA